MPDKVAFATSNWKDRPNKPEEFSQAEWDAYNSSKFNGFPFPTIEKAQDNQPFEQWDKETYYQGVPSKSEEKMISVLGDHYVKFTFDQLIKLHWRMKNGSFNVDYTGAKKKEMYCEEGRPDLSSVTHSSSDSSKNLGNINNSSDINLSIGGDGVTTQGRFTSRGESFLARGGRSLHFSNAYDSLSFSIPVGQQPILKMGENDYRVYFGCNHCGNIEGVCENFVGGGVLPFSECGEDYGNGYTWNCFTYALELGSAPLSKQKCVTLWEEQTGATYTEGDSSYVLKPSTDPGCVAAGSQSRDNEENKNYVAKSDLSCYGCYVGCTEEPLDKFYFYYIMCEDDPEQNCGTVSFGSGCHDSSGAASSPGLSFFGEGFYNTCIGDYPIDAAC
jgi:hypothetical protein